MRGCCGQVGVAMNERLGVTVAMAVSSSGLCRFALRRGPARRGASPAHALEQVSFVWIESSGEVSIRRTRLLNHHERGQHNQWWKPATLSECTAHIERIRGLIAHWREIVDGHK